MPRYFFDVDDGEHLTRDDAGIVLPGADDVGREARTLLENLTVPELMNDRDRLFTVAVRDAQGKTVYRGEMALKISHR